MSNDETKEKKKDDKNNETKDFKENITNILRNYESYERDIVLQLGMLAKHGVYQGSVREEIWKDFFESMVPNKFVVDRGVFIIDSNGNVSNEVDIAIYDNSYTPYVFKFKTLKYIPIEAVAVVVECKSKKPKKIDLVNWIKSIDNLETSDKGIARIVTGLVSNNSDVQSSTRPIKILAGADTNTKTDNLEFDIVIKSNSSKCALNIKYQFLKTNDSNKDCKSNSIKNIASRLNHKLKPKDIILQAKYEKFCFATKNDLAERDLSELFKINQLESEETNSIATFLFVFNQILMLINNPMLFPHYTYAKMFNDHANEFREDEEKKQENVLEEKLQKEKAKEEKKCK